MSYSVISQIRLNLICGFIIENYGCITILYFIYKWRHWYLCQISFTDWQLPTILPGASAAAATTIRHSLKIVFVIAIIFNK